jgi:UPF0716 protein FxsA
MGKLLLLFIVLPIVELIILIQLGGLIGLWPTIGLIVVTGAAGASLARWQGLSVLRQIQLEMTAGKLPAGSLVDGVIILIAAALLVTPGLLTDIFGFLCLVPGFRQVVKRMLKRRFARTLAHGGGGFFIRIGGGRSGGRGPVQ